MSNRFHNKFHRVNHHSVSSPDPKFPDAGYDPIASFDSPFQGEFYSEGDVITTQNLSAGINLTVDNNALIRNNLTVGYDALIENDLTVNQDFFVFGNDSQLDSLVHITSSVDIISSGIEPALTIDQNGNAPIVNVKDDGTSAFFINGDENFPGYVGINTTSPNERLTVIGNISAFGNAVMTENSFVSGNQIVGGLLKVRTIPLGTTNDVITLSGDTIEQRPINYRVWDTSAEFLSANNLTVNYLPRYTGLNTLEDSTIEDTLSGLTIHSDVVIQGTVTAYGSASFINTIFTTTSSISVVNLGAGPALYVYQTSGPYDVASFYDGDGVEVLHVGNSDSGLRGKVGVNTGEPNEDLTVVGNISASGNITTKGVIKSNTVTIIPAPTTVLSLTSNDIIFDGQTTSVIISSFSQGIEGTTYTLTNKNTNTVTITASPTLYVRGGSGANWYSNMSSYSLASIVLLSGHSCSLRADSNTVFSVW